MRFGYHLDHEPPAPVAPVEFCNPVTGASITVFCQIDTGADMCCLPVSIIEYLGETEYDCFPLEGVGAKASDARFHILDVKFCGRSLCELQVGELPGQGCQDPLLGRDVLNQFVVTLNGPELLGEIT